MSIVTMPVLSRRDARPSLRSVPTGPVSRDLQGAGDAAKGGLGRLDRAPLGRSSGLYVDGSLAGVVDAANWSDDAPVAPRSTEWVVPRRTAPRRIRPSGLAAGRPGLRLTQRGRLTRSLVCFGVLCLLVSLAFARLTAPGPVVADRATIVQPGQTLTDIARVQLPAHPVEEGVQMLRELNRMNSTVVVSGQSLLVPAS